MWLCLVGRLARLAFFFLHSGLQDDPRFSGLESVLNGSATLEQAANTVPNGALEASWRGLRRLCCEAACVMPTDEKECHGRAARPCVTSSSSGVLVLTQQTKQDVFLSNAST